MRMVTAEKKEGFKPEGPDLAGRLISPRVNERDEKQDIEGSITPCHH
jgi:hypothetical protein